MKDLNNWRPQLVPPGLTQTSAAQRRARIAGFVLAGSLLAAFVLPFLLLIVGPIVFVTAGLCLYWGWQARKGAAGLPDIAHALGLTYRSSTPPSFVQAMVPLDADMQLTDNGYMAGSIGNPGAVQVQLADVTITSRSGSGSNKQTTSTAVVIAAAALAMPVRFLRVERRVRGQQALRGLISKLGAWWERSWAVPTREITTESAAFNERWRVLVHQDDDLNTALRMFTPEIIVAFTDHRVPFERSLVYHEGNIVIIDTKDPIFTVRQIDYVLHSVLQSARFARVLAREAGMR